MTTSVLGLQYLLAVKQWTRETILLVALLVFASFTSGQITHIESILKTDEEMGQDTDATALIQHSHPFALTLSPDTHHRGIRDISTTTLIRGRTAILRLDKSPLVLLIALRPMKQRTPAVESYHVFHLHERSCRLRVF